MTDTDPDAFQAAIDRWLAARADTPTALARRWQAPHAAPTARARPSTRPFPWSATTTSSRSATASSPTKVVEIAAVRALLEEVDISGAVITLDALHTTRDTATAILHRHRAHGICCRSRATLPRPTQRSTPSTGASVRHGELAASNSARAMAASSSRHIQTMKPETRHAQLPAGQASVSYYPPPPHGQDRRRFQRSRLRRITSLSAKQCGRTAGCWRSIAGTGPSRT